MMGDGFTSTELVYVISGTCVAVGLLVTQIINAVATFRIKNQAATAISVGYALQEKANDIARTQGRMGEQLEVVHKETNSRMSEINAALKLALEKLSIKEEELARAIAERVELANTTARSLERREWEVNQSKLINMQPTNPNSVVVQSAEKVEIVEKPKEESKLIIP